MDAGKFSRSLGELGSRYLSEYRRNVERYSDFVTGAAKRTPGEFAGEALQKRYADFVRREGPRVLGQLADASLSYYTLLVNTGIETTSSFIDQVLQGEESPSDQPTRCQAPAALLFSGRRGESVNNAFLVTNNRSQPIEVSFDVAEVASDDGAKRFRPNIQFAPHTCRLAPNAEQVVQCTLELSDEYLRGQRHRGEIQVVGFPEMAIRISVQVDDPPQAAPVPKRNKTRAKKARSKTSSARTRTSSKEPRS